MFVDDGVRVWSNPVAYDHLGSLAADVTSGVIVELGVREGGTLAHLARSSTVPCFGIDAWGLAGAYADPDRDGAAQHVTEQTMFTAESNTAGLDVTLVRALTTDAAADWQHGPVAMLHIDAAHEQAAILADYGAWFPHLTDDAIVTFDDYKPRRWPGVVAAVDQLVAGGRITRPEIVGNRLAVSRARS